jgi:tRNA G18 (ribose-2'-O)-methylase SpoU
MPEIEITDPHDVRLAEYRTIGEAELVRRRGFFVAEGRLVVRRLLEDSRHHVHSLLLNRSARDALADLLPRWIDRIPIYTCRTGDFLIVTGFDIHRGCLALAERPVEPSWTSVTAAARITVVLEGVANADNVGGVFRNAAAFGADAVLLSPACCDPLYRKAVRTSMAATLRVPFARLEPWPDALNALRGEGFAIVAFTPDPSARTIGEFARQAPTGRLALLFGSEGIGLTGGAQALADECVRIPIRQAVDSLNLAVASGIALSWLTSADLLA